MSRVFPPAYPTFMPHVGATTILLNLLAGNYSSVLPTTLTRFTGRSGDVPPCGDVRPPILHCLIRRCHIIPATTDYAHWSTPLPRVGDYAHFWIIRLSLVHVFCRTRPTWSRARHVITPDDLVGTQAPQSWAHTVHWFDTSRTPSIARHVDLSTTIIHCRLCFSQRSKLFETLKHFAPLHCFIIFFLTPSFRNASANASTPSNILYWTLFWSSKGNLFLTPTDIRCILIGLHHPLTVWSIRCGMLFFALLFSALRVSNPFSASPPCSSCLLYTSPSPRD